MVRFGWAVVCVSCVAQTPMVKTQAGFYRMMLGDFEITALNDGVVDYSVKTLAGATAEQIKNGLGEMNLTDPVGMSYNALLINTGSKLILIDTGTGGKLDELPEFHGCGRLLENLRAAGYRPEQIDEVYITHMGPDHIGGLIGPEVRVFPNATVRIAQREVDAFFKLPKADDLKAVFWRGFRLGLFEPYMNAKRMETFNADVALAPGVRAMATPGHTPGHTSYVVESKGETLIVIGDLVHWGAVQFRYPSASTIFDMDPKAATAQRVRVFQMAAEHEYWIAGAHISFPGIGHVRAGNGRYYWVPANYAIPR
jgi:glyoxylase-like metal-dependent hydrolase (beta-lactamase superfamily II)